MQAAAPASTRWATIPMASWPTMTLRRMWLIQVPIP